MKQCPRCGETKPLEAFHRWSHRDGRQVYCKACRRAYDAAYYARTKHLRPRGRDKNRLFREWYEGLKRGPCADCGGVFPPGVMHWDHLPGSGKIADVGRLARNHNRRAVEEEIAKCELVCANCHALRTASRVGVTGIEPVTSAPQRQRSTRLSYTPSSRKVDRRA